MKFLFTSLVILTFGTVLFAQQDSVETKKLAFTGDFRFRVEHDWNSRNAEGEKRPDRSRLRYRLRLGFTYSFDAHSSFGGRIRSGNLNDQQGPHVTLGGNEGEFRLVSLGLEKLFYSYQSKNFTGWIGKNSIPLVKLNELFWNDNVFPEGIGLSYTFKRWTTKNLNALKLNAGHFIIQSKGGTFARDSYLQLIQLHTRVAQRVEFFPGFYHFRRVGNFPDGKQTYEIDYAILHIGSEVTLDKQEKLKIGLEYYKNLQDYSDADSIPELMQNQTTGYVLSAEYGSMQAKGDWLFYLSYAFIQKYAVVDYLAQNDWARWDYSSVGASGARLSNFRGIELKIGYALKENFNLNLRTYFVEQLVKIGSFKENGSRIRLDMNIGF